RSYNFHDAPIIFKRNFEEVKHLIINLKYTLFLPRKNNDIKPYPLLDGFENITEMNMITREEIRYNICEDTNSLIIQSSMIILFSNTLIKPDKTSVINRINELRNLGFSFNSSIVLEIFILFENRLKEI
ncbi:3247_t:CDS:2, partial [Scutellospora calospora]